MYLILRPIEDPGGTGFFTREESPNRYSTYYTKNTNIVAEALKEEGVHVYKLDGLTRVRSIEMTYREVTMEMDNE